MSDISRVPTGSITDHARVEGVYHSHLTGIRAIAALSVCLLHVWVTVYQGPGGVNLAHPWWNGWLRSGGVGVAVFIVVSGYSLMLAPARRGGWFAEGARSFFIRRARRILPAYFAVLAVSILLGLTVLAHPSDFVSSLATPVNPADVIWHVLLLHDVLGNASGINYVLWSMAVEWHIYVLMPLLLLAVRRVGVWPTVLIAVLTSSLVARLALNHSQIRLLFEFHLVGCFFIGAGACWIAQRRPPVRIYTAAAGTLAALWVMLEWASYRGLAAGVNYPQGRALVLAAAVGGLLVVAPQVSYSRPVKLLGCGPLVWAGERSYSFYLWHPLVLALVWNLGLDTSGWDRGVQFLVLVAIGVLATVGMSAVTYRQVEVRFQASPTMRHRR